MKLTVSDIYTYHRPSKCGLRVTLKEKGITCTFDDRGNHNPGFMFSEWEMKGTPFQFRIGPKEVKHNNVYCVRRDNVRSEIKFDQLELFELEINAFQT